MKWATVFLYEMRELSYLRNKLSSKLVLQIEFLVYMRSFNTYTRISADFMHSVTEFFLHEY